MSHNYYLYIFSPRWIIYDIQKKVRKYLFYFRTDVDFSLEEIDRISILRRAFCEEVQLAVYVNKISYSVLHRANNTKY